MHAGDVDDRRVGRFLEQGQHGLADGKEPALIDSDDFVELLHGRVFQSLEEIDARVVDEEVEASGFGSDRVAHSLDVGRRGDIALQISHFEPLRFKFGKCLQAFFFIATIEVNGGAAAGEDLGAGVADAFA